MRKSVSLSALVFLLPAGVAVASPECSRIYVVDPALDYAAKHDGLWLPSAEEVETARQAMLAYLAAPHPPEAKLAPEADWNERNRPYIRDRIESYVLQFAGVRLGEQREFYSTQGKGPRVILITGLCKVYSSLSNLTRELAQFADGGNCYFIALYDPATARIVEFQVNGLA